MRKYIYILLFIAASYNSFSENKLSIQEFNCKKIIYDSILDNLNRVSVSQDFFDSIDNLSLSIKQNIHFVRIQKINNEIYYEYYDHGADTAEERLLVFLQFLEKNKNEFHDFDMIINLWDENNVLKSLHYNKIFYSGPIFTTGYSNKDLEIFNNKEMFVLIPDPHVLPRSYHDNIIKAQKLNLKFTDKTDKALFRGAPHIGGGVSDIVPELFRHHPRGKIFLLSYIFPEYIDAKPVGEGVYDLETEGGKALKHFINIIYGPDLAKNHMDWEEQSKYRYIVSLDGIAASWSRPQIISFTGSLLLHQSAFTQWFSKAMIAGYNYIHLENDLSDLLEKIKWSRQNTKQVQEIIHNQIKTANKCFTYEEVQNQLKFILEKYSNKFSYKITNKSFNKFNMNDTKEDLRKSKFKR